MTPREEAHRLIDRLSVEELEMVNRMLRGLAPVQEAVPPEGPGDERFGRITALVEKHEKGAKLSDEEYIELVSALRGSLKGSGHTVEDFLRERREDTEREEVRFERRGQERAA